MTPEKQAALNLNRCKVEDTLHLYSSGLYSELDRMGFISRMRKTPQLSIMKKELGYSKYDYMCLQVHLHDLVHKNINSKLRYSYAGDVSLTSLVIDNRNKEFGTRPSISDVIQILILICNVGHFFNTYTASRSALELAIENEMFMQMLRNSSSDSKYLAALNDIVEKKDYLKFHLLNAMLILNRCDQSQKSIKLAKAILCEYVAKGETDGKLCFAFLLFTKIRDIAYIVFGLKVARVPLNIDVKNEEKLLFLLEEYLSEFNDQTSSAQLIDSTKKLLNDTVYNESYNTICYCRIADRIAQQLKNDCGRLRRSYYDGCFLDETSPLNCRCQLRHIKDYDQSQILKLTFERSDAAIADKLLQKLKKAQRTRVGYYNRAKGERTLLVSIKKNASLSEKQKTAFGVMKNVAMHLRANNSGDCDNAKYLLCVKFFLYYLFNEHPLVIKASLGKNPHTVQNGQACVFCTRGSANRVQNLENLLKESTAGDDAKHEVEFMKSLLEQDKLNDTTICIPASIEVQRKDNPEKTLHEFDGLIIHPMRKHKQIIFLEAKNKKGKKNEAANCLEKALMEIGPQFGNYDIHTIVHDAYMLYSIE